MSAFVNLISRWDDRGVNQANSSLKKSGSNFTKFGKIAGAAFAGVAVAAGAMAVKIGIDSVKAYVEDEAAARKLAVTLKNVTNATKKQTAGVEDWITKTMFATGVADDQLRPAYARLLRSTESTTKSQKLLNLALDISSGTGKSLDTVVAALGKSVDGNNASLGRLGLGLDATTLKTGSTEEIMGQLRDQFKGFAKADANTVEGKMKRLTLRFSETKEMIGGVIVNALTPLSDWIFSKGVPLFQKFSDNLGKIFGPAIKTAQKFIKDDLIPALIELGNWIRDKIVPLALRLAKVWTENILPALKWVATFIIDYVVPAIQSFLAPALEAIVGTFETVSNAIKDNQANFEPLIKVIEFLAGFVRDTLAPIFGTILGKAFEIVGGVIVGLIKGFGFVLKIGKKLWDFFGGAKDLLVKAFGGLTNIITAPFKTAFNLIADLWNNTIGKIEFTLPDWVPGLGGKGFKMPKIPKMAQGGIVNKPTLALIGEAGPEAVVPLNRSNRMGNVNITINGAIDAEGTARQIRQILRRSELRAGAF